MKKEYFCKSINKSKFPNMKIIRFVFLLVLWFTTATLSAQNLKLFHEDVEVSNGEINIAELTSDGEVKVIINIQNTSSDAIDIKVKKNVREDIEGAENTFCLGSCFDPSVIESPVTYTIGAGETTDADDFYVLFLPHGNVGEALIVYDVFNANNPEDRVNVTVHFTITPTGIGLTENDVVLNLYPNPASGNSLTVEYSLPNVDNTELVIYNMLGERLIVQPVLQPTGILGVDISKLTKGIYIVSFEQSGLSLVTRKYIISR